MVATDVLQRVDQRVPRLDLGFDQLALLLQGLREPCDALVAGVLKELDRRPIGRRQARQVAEVCLGLLDRRAPGGLGLAIEPAGVEQVGLGAGDRGAPARSLQRPNVGARRRGRRGRRRRRLGRRGLVSAASAAATRTTLTVRVARRSAASARLGLATLGIERAQALDPALGLGEAAALDIVNDQLVVAGVQPATGAAPVVDLGALLGVADRVGEIARHGFGAHQAGEDRAAVRAGFVGEGERLAQILELLGHPADLTGGGAALEIEARQRRVRLPGRRLAIGGGLGGAGALRVGLVGTKHARDVGDGARWCDGQRRRGQAAA